MRFVNRTIDVTIGAVPQFGIGFNISKYGLTIDLGPFYIGVEW